MMAGSAHTHSAVLPVRRAARGQVEVCLITSRKGLWIFPKGWIEPGMSPERSALKEAWEEAGLRGDVRGDLIGTVVLGDRPEDHVVAVYVMEVTEVAASWPEAHARRREFVAPERAQGMVAAYLAEVLKIGLSVATERLADEA